MSRSICLAHINHIRSVAGIDSVGIGSDFDGIEEYVSFILLRSFFIRQFLRTPVGLEDVSTYPKLIEFLVSQNNWTDTDIIQLIGGNIIRVLDENEQVRLFHFLSIIHEILFQIARNLQQTMQPLQDLIPIEDLNKYNLTLCRNLDMYSTADVN